MRKLWKTQKNYNTMKERLSGIFERFIFLIKYPLAILLIVTVIVCFCIETFITPIYVII